MNTLLLTLIVLSFGVAANALECHYCLSLVGLNPDCEADPYNENATYVGTESCDGYCVKEWSKVDGAVTSFSRGCSTSCDDPGCSSFFALSSCKYCCNDADKCNSASFLSLSHLVLVSSAVMLLFVLRL